MVEGWLLVAAAVPEELMVELEVLEEGPVLAAATAAAAAATNEDEEIDRDEGLKVADELLPLAKPEERVESFECLLARELDGGGLWADSAELGLAGALY